jgi:hypothetical protein
LDPSTTARIKRGFYKDSSSFVSGAGDKFTLVVFGQKAIGATGCYILDMKMTFGSEEFWIRKSQSGHTWISLGLEPIGTRTKAYRKA